MLLILSFVLLAYVATANVLTTQDDKVLPSGDPFTYTLGFIDLRDIAHDRLSRGLTRAIHGNWYWLQNFIIFALSPVLGRDPASIAAMNYLCLAVALCALYAAGRQITNVPAVALLGVAGIVHLPWLYGSIQHGQLLCVTLDCTFFWIVSAAWSCMFLYSLEPTSNLKALLAAVTTSLAIWGRGNSLPIIGVVLGIPLLAIVSRMIFHGPRARLVKPAAIYFVLTTLSAGVYLWINLGKILEYYHFLHKDAVPVGLLQKLTAICSPPRWVLYNIPSALMLSNSQYDSTAALITSIIMHVFTLATGAWLLWHSRRMQAGGRPIALLAASMLSIYVVVFGLGNYAILGVREHRTFHVFNMMLLPFSVLLMAGIIVVSRRREVLIRSSAPWIAGLAGTSAFVFAVLFSKFHAFAPTDLACASPSEVRAVSVGLDRITEGRPLAVIWYANYNPVIFNYYRFLEGLPFCNSYANFAMPMFHPVAEQVDPEQFHEAMRTTLEEADFVLIPQDPADYKHVFHCKLQRAGSAELSAFYADTERPDYRVRMVLHDVGGVRLLLLERLEEHAAPGTPLILPRPFHGATEEMAWNAVQEDKVPRPVAGPLRFSLRKLLDSSPNSFWEGYGPYPHTIRVKNGARSGPIASYRLGADSYAPQRMPSSWRVEGSNDLQEWVLLDRRSQVQWSAGKSQEFSFESPVAFQFFQFVFETGQEGILRLGDLDMCQMTPSGKEAVSAREIHLSLPGPGLAKSDTRTSLR